jgi:hypothetical protein
VESDGDEPSLYEDGLSPTYSPANSDGEPEIDTSVPSRRGSRISTI